MALEQVLKSVMDRKEDLHELSRYLWEHPELAFQEVLAHEYLTDFLEKEGFQVQRNYVLPTAFKAEYTSPGGEGRCVAICCEYDALPEIGHGCGHNLIAESSVAAGIAVKEYMKSNPSVQGKVIIMGTPAEEGGNGKEILLNGKAFEGVDVAMMAHPGARSILKLHTNARLSVNVKYHGKNAHAGSRPWEGANALDAAVAAYVNISMLRQQMKPEWRAHGIFVKGGSAPNVIPDETELQFMFRTPTMDDLKVLYEKVDSCFQSAASAAGCTATVQPQNRNLNIVPNEPLAMAYAKNAEKLGMTFYIPPEQPFNIGGSSDMGTISHSIPSIHPTFAINCTFGNHTQDFTKGAGKEEAQEPTLKTAAALALTAIDVLTDPELFQAVFESFAEVFPGVTMP